MRLGGIERKYGNWSWPLAYVLGILGALYFRVRGKKQVDDLIHQITNSYSFKSRQNSSDQGITGLSGVYELTIWCTSTALCKYMTPLREAGRLVSHDRPES